MFIRDLDLWIVLGEPWIFSKGVVAFLVSWFLLPPTFPRFSPNLCTFNLSFSVSTETMATACMLVSEGRCSEVGVVLCSEVLFARGDTEGGGGEKNNWVKGWVKDHQCCEHLSSASRPSTYLMVTCPLHWVGTVTVSCPAWGKLAAAAAQLDFRRTWRCECPRSCVAELVATVEGSCWV